MWADDELLYQLHDLASHATCEQHVQVWDPLLTTSVCKYGIDSWAASVGSSFSGVSTFITVIAVCHHWIPVVWRKEEHSLLAYVANASAQHVEVITRLHRALCFAWKVPVTDLHNRTILTDMSPVQGCGLIAIEFIDHLLRGKDLVFEKESLLAKHSLYRQGFIDGLSECIPRPWIWGNGQGDPKNVLLAILKQHGIDDADLHSRYEMLCSKLGRDKVNATAASSNPWKELKGLANQSLPPVQIILPSELQESNRSACQVVSSPRSKKEGWKGDRKREKQRD